jgi:hypothetical protein
MTRLPNEFRDLQDLADLFAIADDAARDRVEGEIADELKHELVARVWPKLGSINQWLDKHDDEEAHPLGRLAEAACEVKLELGRKATASPHKPPTPQSPPSPPSISEAQASHASIHFR